MNTLKSITNIEDIKDIPVTDLLKYEEIQQLLVFSPGTKVRIVNERFLITYNEDVKIVVDDQEYYITIKLTSYTHKVIASIEVFKDLSFLNLNKNAYSVDRVSSVIFFDDSIDNYDSYKEQVDIVETTPWYNYVRIDNPTIFTPYTLFDDESVEYALSHQKTRYSIQYKDYLKTYMEGVSTLDLGGHEPLWKQIDLVWPEQTRVDALKYTFTDDNCKFYFKSYTESKGNIEVYYMSLGFDSVLYRVELETLRDDVYANNVKYFSKTKTVVNKVDSIYCSNRKSFEFLVYLLGFVPSGIFSKKIKPLELLSLSVGFYDFYHIETFERNKPLTNELTAKEVNELLNNINIKLDPESPHYLNKSNSIDFMGTDYYIFVENSKSYVYYIYNKASQTKDSKKPNSKGGKFGWKYV